MRSRIIAMLAACLLTISLGSIVIANPSYAATEYEYCATNACLNAWNGGPEINVYPLSQGIANSHFIAVTNTISGYTNIQFVGNSNSSYNDDCIGDLGNSSTDARAGLYSNCEAGTVAWGANFVETSQFCPGSEVSFYNVHWQAYLGPADLTTGDAFYLNKPDPGLECFSIVID